MKVDRHLHTGKELRKRLERTGRHHHIDGAGDPGEPCQPLRGGENTLVPGKRGLYGSESRESGEKVAEAKRAKD